MSLVRWFRKNNTKIMAIVVIVILFGFIGGSTLLQFLDRRQSGLGETIAYFGDGKEITNYDLIMARQDLGILKMLRADTMLRNIILPGLGTRTVDLHAVLLGEVLFASQQSSPELMRSIKQTIRSNSYRITDEQIGAIYTDVVASELCWLLLSKEAEHAGIRVPNELAGNLLAKAMRELLPGASYSALIGAMVKGNKNQPGIPESRILATLGKLMAVLEYSKIICSNEDITTAQIMYSVNLQGETMDVEFVKFDSAEFIESESEPSKQEISEQFEKYKNLPAGAISDANPYGFGYKLEDRVKLEYIVCQLGDIARTVTAPTQEEAQDFYQQYRNQFTEQVPSDPNDPNSPPMVRTRSYAEVASGILKQLQLDKINSKANAILQDAKALVGAGFDGIQAEGKLLEPEEYRQAAMSVDYAGVAEQLAEQYNIKIYAGQTGLLSTNDIQRDEYLGKLYMGGYGYNIAGLAEMVFAIDELGSSILGPFDVAKPRMYESIGPLKDVAGINFMQDVSEQIMAIVRVVEVQKASEPESVNQAFSMETLRLEEPADEETYSISDKVVEDLKKLSAMETTRTKAEELIVQAAQVGWEEALDKLNELYGQEKENEDDPNTFELQELNYLSRLSGIAKKTMALQSVGQPGAEAMAINFEKETLLRDKLYELVPQDANSLDDAPVVMEFKPNLNCYLIKSLSVRRIEQGQYESAKAPQSYQEDLIQYQSLAVVHFKPGNILKRMNFKPAEEPKQITDTNTPAAGAGAGEPQEQS